MEMDPWKACRGLLASLQYEFSKEINFASKGDLILLVTWLEDRKIRELDIEWRKPLRSDGPEWDNAFNNYLQKVGCPYKWENLAEDDSKDAIAWLISYAVSAEYEDIADTCNDMENKTYLSANEENKGGSARMDESEAENEYDSVLAPEVDKLGSMLLLKRGQGEGDHEYLQRVSRQIKLILTPGSLNALQTLGKDGIPLESFPSVFETTDEVLKQVSVVLRMLYLYDFRELQNDLNALIVLGQEYTANPKTNNALGVVGRSLYSDSSAMSMRGGKIPIFTVRMRMERLEERTNDTVLPPIEDLFRKEEMAAGLTKEFVENMTFSKYPEVKKSSASALKAMLMNTNNLDELRACGIVGSIIEAVRRVDLKKEEEVQGSHIEHLVESLHILTENNEGMLIRLVSHPMGTKTIIRLCRSLRDKLQALCFDILEWIHQMMDGPRELLNYDILKTLLSPTFLFKKTTSMDVRHRACHLISQLSPKAPMLFDPEVMNMLVLEPKSGKRRIDGYMEMQLLSSLLVHMAWRERVQKGFLPFTFTLISHLLNEVMGEHFESVEHMQQIMRIAVILSKDPKHADYMWSHRLDASLQYLVKTDFSLYRRKAETSSGTKSEEKAKMDKIKKSNVGKAKRKSILDSGERPASTLMFLSLVKPDKGGKNSAARNEDINFFTTRYVVILYENIMNVKMEIVHDLVSSGVLGALLFRVGKGSDRNPRFNKLVTHFLHQILGKVMLYQPHKGHHMSMLPSGKVTKLHCYVSRGEECPPPTEEFLAQQEASLAVGAGGDGEKNALISAPVTAPGTRVGTANDNTRQQRSSFVGGGGEVELSGLPGADGKAAGRGKVRGILAEAMAMQAEEQARAIMESERESMRQGEVLGSSTASGSGKGKLMVETGAPGAASTNPSGLTPGPGFRKRLQNTQADYDFPKDEEGNNLYPPASPMSPIHTTARPGSVGFAVEDSMGSIDSFTPFGGDGGMEGDVSVLGEPSGVMGDVAAEMSSFDPTKLNKDDVKEIHRLKIMAQSTDLRSISNTLTAQGIVQNFFETLRSPQTEELAVVKEALVGMAIMDFNTYHFVATERRNITALFQIYRQRHDLFFPFLHVLCEMIQSFEVDEKVLEHLVSEHRCTVMLMQAMNLSGWHFHRRDQVYRCFGKLAQVCGKVLYDQLSDSGGISTLCREVELRKAKTRQGRRGNAADDEGDGTEQLMPLLKRDMAATRIQAQVRRRRGVQKVAKVRQEKKEWDDFLSGEKAKKEKEEKNKARMAGRR